MNKVVNDKNKHEREHKAHILYVIARFIPFKGGAEENCYQLAKRAAADGYQVTVLTTNLHPDPTRTLPYREHIDGIDIIRVTAWNRQLNLGFYPGMFKEILSTKADIVHVCNGAGFIWRDLCLFAKRLRDPTTKFIITPHGPFLATPDTHSGFKKLLAKLGRLVMSPYFKFAWQRLFDKVIAVNSHQYKWLNHQFNIGQDRVAVVPNGIPSEYIDQDLDKPEIENRLLLTGLGRWEKYKNFQTTIKAIDIINKSDKKDQMPEVHLTLMGSGIYEQELRDLVAEKNLENKIDFLVNPADKERDLVLRYHSHVHVLVSDWEATGIVLIEALAKGNIIITSTSNEAANLVVDDAENGFVVKPGDPEQLATKLMQLIKKPTQTNKMMNSALSKASQYTWENIYPSYKKVIKSI